MTVTRTRDRPTLTFFWSVNIDSALARLYVSYIAVVRLHSLKHGYFRYFRLELQLRRPWSRDRTVRERTATCRTRAAYHRDSAYFPLRIEV